MPLRTSSGSADLDNRITFRGFAGVPAPAFVEREIVDEDGALYLGCRRDQVPAFVSGSGLAEHG